MTDDLFNLSTDGSLDGRACADRQWVECFVQLTGTVLCLWDASALDAAGEVGEVPPTFINISDATIKMVCLYPIFFYSHCERQIVTFRYPQIEKLPTRNDSEQPLQNVLSLSTAGKNRYLLLFKTYHSLTKWTAAIRLAMFENTLLQESYTGALIAGKGKTLNGIKAILERTRFNYEDWVRVRFGPGTPWKRYWCVITPPDEKQIQKYQKQHKKKSAYDRSTPVFKGTVKFYETKKTKKVQPIATITDAYSAYAIYPQSRPLVNQSTLVKVEGQIIIHSQSSASTEGFVFVLPEMHAAVSGFEIMLRWLFPVFDTFGLYGRPTRLVADTRSTRSLMFALPKRKRHGYLDLLDVSALIHTPGSENWSEADWRKQLKDATAKRLTSNVNSRENSISVAGSRRPHRSTMPSRTGTALRFDTSAANPSGRPEFNNSTDAVFSSNTDQKSDTFDDGSSSVEPYPRAVSDNHAVMYGSNRAQQKSMIEEEDERAPSPLPVVASNPRVAEYATNDVDSRSSSNYDQRESSSRPSDDQEEVTRDVEAIPPLAPVAVPPEFSHEASATPAVKPQTSPEMHQAGYRMSTGTLGQMLEVNKMAVAGATAAWKDNRKSEAPIEQGQRGMMMMAQRGSTATTTGEDLKYADSKTAFESAINPGAPRQFENKNAVGQFASATSSPSPSAFAPASAPTADAAVAVAGHASNSRSNNNDRRSLPLLDTRRTSVVARKPLPQDAKIDYNDISHSPASSLGSLRNSIDFEALNRIVARVPSPPPAPSRVVNRQPIQQEDESVYDQSSVASPDYASSYSSVAKRSIESVERPRMGVKKVVGGGEPESHDLVIGDAHYQPAMPAPHPDSEIPLVDFGPTQSYNPTTRRPSTSDTLNLFGHNRNPSDATLKGNHERKQSKPDNRENREERRRSIAWQPGAAMGGRSSPGPRITAEQYVQQLADNHRGNSPSYPHRRGPSGNALPPRPASGDWTSFNRQQSMMARDLPPRPHSRGASIMLGQREASPQLSAREQEQVARATGSPFINLNTETSRRQPSPVLSTGLIGTIDAREREKKAIKEGVSGQMVQQAMAQHQLHTSYSPSPAMPYLPPGQQPSQYPPVYHHYHQQQQQQQPPASTSGMSTYGYFPPPQHLQDPWQSREWLVDQQQQQQPQSQQYHNRQYSLSSTQQLRQQQISPPPPYRPNPYYQQ